MSLNCVGIILLEEVEGIESELVLLGMAMKKGEDGGFVIGWEVMNVGVEWEQIIDGEDKRQTGDVRIPANEIFLHMIQSPDNGDSVCLRIFDENGFGAHVDHPFNR